MAIEMDFWKNGDSAGFHQALLDTTSIYLTAVQKYQNSKRLENCTGSKQWWSLLTSLTGSSSRGRIAVPPVHQLASYFSSRLSCSSTLDEPPSLADCHR